MTGVGAYIIFAAALLLAAYAASRRDASLKLGLARAIEQLVTLMPRMVCALIAAGFMVNLVPTEIIGRFLGPESGFTGILIGSFAGLIVPAGPVVAFAIAAAFASEGASTAALVAFVTGWSLFTAHRIFIFELPLLGFAFVRFRILAVAILPFIAGTLALAATTWFSTR